MLADRRWSGSRRSTIDAILVGPGGVVALDVKDWQDVSLRGGSLFGSQECRDAEAAAVRGLTDHVQDALAGFGITRQALWSVLVVTGGRLDLHADNVHVVGEDDLAVWVAARPARLEKSEIDAIATCSGATSRRTTRPTRWPPGGPGPRAPGDARGSRRLCSAPPPRADGRWMTFLTEAQVALVHRAGRAPPGSRVPPAAARPSSACTGRRTSRSGTPRRSSTSRRPTRRPGSLHAGRPADAAGPRQGRLREPARPRGGDRAAGRRALNLDDRQASIAFVSAWMASGRGGALSQLDERPGYWQEEIDHVVKARGITELDDYLTLERDPRQVPFDDAQRTAVWRVLSEYKRRLTKSKVHDLDDVLVLARDLVRGGVVRPTYSAVIVDNAEDLPLVGLELLRLLAGDGPDRLLLIDDGQQASYAGSDTLAAAGITLSAPASQLTDDHRSSGDVLRLATRMIGTDNHVDIEGHRSGHLAGTPVRRRGVVPTVVDVADLDELERELVYRLTEITDSESHEGEIAVLVATPTDVDHLRTVLMRAALPVVDIAGVVLAGGRIVLGTYAEAKGLSFDHVLMPGLRSTPSASRRARRGVPRAWRAPAAVAVRRHHAGSARVVAGLRPRRRHARRPGRPTSPTDARRASRAPRRPGWRAAGCASWVSGRQAPHRRANVTPAARTRVGASSSDGASAGPLRRGDGEAGGLDRLGGEHVLDGHGGRAEDAASPPACEGTMLRCSVARVRALVDDSRMPASRCSPAAAAGRR